MAIFATSAATQTTLVNTSGELVFDTDASGVPTGASLPDVTIVNAGTVTCYVGQAAVSGTQGFPLLAGQQMLIRGYLGNQASTAGDIYAITAAGTTTVRTGLATGANIA